MLHNQSINHDFPTVSLAKIFIFAQWMQWNAFCSHPTHWPFINRIFPTIFHNNNPHIIRFLFLHFNVLCHAKCLWALQSSDLQMFVAWRPILCANVILKLPPLSPPLGGSTLPCKSKTSPQTFQSALSIISSYLPTSSLQEHYPNNMHSKIQCNHSTIN